MDADSIIGTLYAINDLQGLQIKVLRSSDSLLTNKYGECTVKNSKLDNSLTESQDEAADYKRQGFIFKMVAIVSTALLVLVVAGR